MWCDCRLLSGSVSPSAARVGLAARRGPYAKTISRHRPLQIAACVVVNVPSATEHDWAVSCGGPGERKPMGRNVHALPSDFGVGGPSLIGECLVSLHIREAHHRPPTTRGPLA